MIAAESKQHKTRTIFKLQERTDLTIQVMMTKQTWEVYFTILILKPSKSINRWKSRKWEKRI